MYFDAAVICYQSIEMSIVLFTITKGKNKLVCLVHHRLIMVLIKNCIIKIV